MNTKKDIRLYLVLVVFLFILTGCGSNNKEHATLDANNVNEVYQKTFSYDSTNRVVKEDFGNGNYIEYVYDDNGNLVSQTIVK